MSLLAIQRPGARLSLSGALLRLELNGKVVQTKPLHEVSEVQLHGATDLTRGARNALLKAGVDVVFFDGHGRYLGRLSGPLSKAGARRLSQMRFLSNEASALALAQQIIDGKLEHQRRFLLRLNRRRPAPRLTAGAVALRRLRLRIPDTQDLDTLRGLEGQAAALYFRGLDGAVLTDGFHFAQRNRRPPRDPFNACLSFGYTLLLIRVESALLRAGLDPYVGALHAAIRNAPSLALDLMEPYRTHIDRLILRLVNRRQIDAADFVNPDLTDADRARPPDGAPVDPRPPVYLGPTVREIFIRAFAAEWRSPIRYEPADRRLALGDIVQRQAYEFAKLFEGQLDAFTPFVPR